MFGGASGSLLILGSTILPEGATSTTSDPRLRGTTQSRGSHSLLMANSTLAAVCAWPPSAAAGLSDPPRFHDAVFVLTDCFVTVPIHCIGLAVQMLIFVGSRHSDSSMVVITCQLNNIFVKHDLIRLAVLVNCVGLSVITTSVSLY